MPIHDPPRRHWLALILITVCLAGIAEEQPVLFKIWSVKATGDFVVALPDADVPAASDGDLTRIGRALAGEGQFPVWLYAVRRAADGQLEQAPLAHVSLVGHDSLRVKPYKSPLRVAPPPH